MAMSIFPVVTYIAEVNDQLYLKQFLWNKQFIPNLLTSLTVFLFP